MSLKKIYLNNEQLINNINLFLNSLTKNNNLIHKNKDLLIGIFMENIKKEINKNIDFDYNFPENKNRLILYKNIYKKWDELPQKTKVFFESYLLVLNSDGDIINN